MAHDFKYWIAKSLDYINIALKSSVFLAMALVTVPYLAVMSVFVLLFIGLHELNDLFEGWFNLKRENLIIGIERASNVTEKEDLQLRLDREPKKTAS